MLVEISFDNNFLIEVEGGILVLVKDIQSHSKIYVLEMVKFSLL